MAEDIIDFLRETRDCGGSDLHLTVGAPPSARVNGKLHPLGARDLTEKRCKDLVYAVLTEAQRTLLKIRGNLILHYMRIPLEGLEAMRIFAGGMLRSHFL